jgi:hypothetical protein
MDLLKLFKKLALAIISLSTIVFPTAGQSQGDMQELPYKRINFLVRDKDSSAPISEGKEEILFKDGLMTKKTLYWLAGDKEQKIIQEETCSFELTTLRPLSYQFRNFATGESVVLSGLNVTSFADKLTYRDALDKQEVTVPFKWQQNLIIGKTLHHLIVRSWENFTKNESKSFPLYVPMKRDLYMFRVTPISAAKKSDENVKVISLEPDNWAFRQLAPSMFFHYEKRNNIPTLVKYEGPTRLT